MGNFIRVDQNESYEAMIRETKIWTFCLIFLLCVLLKVNFKLLGMAIDSITDSEY